MTRWRRLVRDYEARIDVSQAMILVAMVAIARLLRLHYGPAQKIPTVPTLPVSSPPPVPCAP